MPDNYVLLEKIVVGAAGASSVTFSGIPQTGYTDLVVKLSTRTSNSNVFGAVTMDFNGSTSSQSSKYLFGSGSSVGSSTRTDMYIGDGNGNTSTSDTFSNMEVYIPNYTGSNNKSASSDGVGETNATTIYASLQANLWSDTAAITSIRFNSITGGGSFVQNSTFYLYGVAKLGTTPAIVPYATGGDTIMTDGTYWYHAFTSSGTFTPQKGISCDVLVVAGGGSGGTQTGAGGGAGGLLLHSNQSLTAQNYTCTIGAGGAGATGAPGNNGSNSQFASLTASVGGGGGANYANLEIGKSGGSGGGGYPNGGTAAGGTATSGQGNNGGSGSTDNATYRSAGGGGGAGAAGGNGNTSAPAVSGAGGNGVSTYSAWGLATGTGQNISGTVWFAGGGGGANTGVGAGGNGGGTAGSSIGNSTAATANTGGGSGGGNSTGAGGSGIVIVRYLV